MTKRRPPSSRLAARDHVNEGTLARSLLSTAIDDADPDVASVVAVLDGIEAAWERAQLGSLQAGTGETIPPRRPVGRSLARVDPGEGSGRGSVRIILTHSLPLDTTARVRASLDPLCDLSAARACAWGRGTVPRRIGPWRSLILVYRHLAEDDRVVVVTIQDVRTAGAVINP